MTDADLRGPLGRLGSWWRGPARGATHRATGQSATAEAPSTQRPETAAHGGAEALPRARSVPSSGGDEDGGRDGRETTEAAVQVRYLDGSKPAEEQEPWRCVALTTIDYALTLAEAITQRPGMEAGVVALSAMQPREILRCRAEASKSRLLFAPTAPLGGGGRGA